MSRQVNLTATAGDGHAWELIGCVPAARKTTVLWLPALGVSARNYLPLAQALAGHGVATFVHEWRGNGSSSLRPSRTVDWGYREILQLDLPASLAAISGEDTGPVLLGGHSLGGQLSCCFAALHPNAFSGLLLVASGTPWWRSFPAPRRFLLPLAYRFLPWLARHQGVLHGRRIGFGGREARGLIADWARVGLTNRYAARDWDVDLEQAISQLQVPASAVVMDEDWLAPESSMRALLGKMPNASTQLQCLSAQEIRTRADHFAWMKRPERLVQRLLDFSAPNFSQKH